VEIRSPDYIIGRLSGQRREVDVSLRSRVGSVDVLVIIECRDRSKAQGVTWIEQLASKREDVGADKAVAVSAAGFTPGAQNLARSEQVELRSFEELSADVVFDWLHAEVAEHRNRHVDAINLSVDLADGVTAIDPAKLAPILESIDRLRVPQEGLAQDDKAFVHKADLAMVSIDDIPAMMPFFGARFDEKVPDLPPGEKRRMIWTICFEDDPKFAVAVNSDQFPVARRRHGPRPPSRLELTTADLVLSGDESLPAAPAEIAALDGLLSDRGLSARHIDDLPGLLQAFQRADTGLLHFSCHNAFSRSVLNASRILLGNQPFEPVFLEAHAGRFPAPLVFLNACRTDGQAPQYTTVEGWAASFLRAGAGAFIGSLWEVVDTSASTYAQEFYRAALAGRTLGEAAKQGRDAIRDNPGDPTWLAYTLYGDPAATVSTAARPGG
jgi:hypothetical protein